MTTQSAHFKDFTSLALPALLLAAGLVAMGMQGVTLPSLFDGPSLLTPQTVTLPAGEVTYRAPGLFLRDGLPVDAPMTTASFAAPVVMMTYQVSAADYAGCVADGVCLAAAPYAIGMGNVPVTGVNYSDAVAYARWLSDKTDQEWVLPSDAEWAYAAGNQFGDDALGTDAAKANPALRWLADYKKESARQRDADPVPRALGSFGSNENGLMDMAGNIWEWTDTCHRRVHVDAAGAIMSETPACTIRTLEGKHRTATSFFIRDAKSGGCSVGVPPDNLGFRLVRKLAWHEQVLARFGF